MTTDRSIIKIFIDGHSFDKEFQGTRTFIKELYSAMAQKTDRIAFYIGANDTENLEKEFASCRNFHFIRYSSSSAMMRLNMDIPRILKTHGIQFAHFQYIAPFRSHCRYIVTTHDILFNDFKEEFSWKYRVVRNFLFKHSIKRAQIKTTVSNYSKARIHHHYGIPLPELHVVKNGVGAEFFAPYDKADIGSRIREQYGISNYILYVSRLEPRKNHVLLLKSYLDLKLYDKGIQLVFIGRETINDPELDSLLGQMPPNARKNFYRIDQVDQHDLLNFYRAARLFAYPSKAEGFGIPPLEAGAMQVPVLCSNQTAMSDFTFFGDRFFDPSDDKDLKAKLELILSSPIDRKRDLDISESIRLQYAWSASAAVMLDLIGKHVNQNLIS